MVLYLTVNNCVLGASGVTLVVVTAAGVICVPVLYGINKRRRDLGLEPLPFLGMFQNFVKMIQSLVARANFLKDNSSHRTEEINDERIERISFDWEERSSNSLEFPVQLLPLVPLSDNPGITMRRYSGMREPPIRTRASCIKGQVMIHS